MVQVNIKNLVDEVQCYQTVREGSQPLIRWRTSAWRCTSFSVNTMGHRFKPGHPAPSITCRYGLTALPGQGQRVDL
jgi:hypothetical protein